MIQPRETTPCVYCGTTGGGKDKGVDHPARRGGLRCLRCYQRYRNGLSASESTGKAKQDPSEKQIEMECEKIRDSDAWMRRHKIRRDRYAIPKIFRLCNELARFSYDQ